MSLNPIGRFAPSPTGPLHFGSLVAAVGSYLQARSRGGRWLVRIEDLDPPREVAGAADDILRTLDAYGFQWDGPVMYQSTRATAYDETLERLRRLGIVYRCVCSRKEVTRAAQAAGLDPGVYPGTCRARQVGAHEPHALRVETPYEPVRMVDAVQGPVIQNLRLHAGDFVLRRRDGLYAYQLAVVVDDAEQAITEVVRGSDLLDSTPRQIHLQRLLGLPTPRYLHLPVAVNGAGKKLSKQTFAAALPRDRPVPALFTALRFLGQNPPPTLTGAALEDVWAWALQHWRTESIPRELTLPIPPEEAAVDQTG